MKCKKIPHLVGGILLLLLVVLPLTSAFGGLVGGLVAMCCIGWLFDEDE